MGQPKLTNQQIEEIKILYKPSKGGSQRGVPRNAKYTVQGSLTWLAQKFNVSAGAIHAVIRGERKNNRTAEERFLAFVQKQENGCWFWTGSTDSDGYGYFSLSPTQKAVSAHRSAWILFKGVIPEGQCVLHSCDTPPCVNPNHLFLGTHKENIADKVAKGRITRTAKLTEAQVLEIRALYQPRKGGRPKGHKVDAGQCEGSIQWLADRYGVAKPTIKHIIRKQSWKHLIPINQK